VPELLILKAIEMKRCWCPHESCLYVSHVCVKCHNVCVNTCAGSHGLLKGFMKGLGLTVDNTLPSAAALRYGVPVAVTMMALKSICSAQPRGEPFSQHLPCFT
jgi:hypothetical protein